MWCAEMTCTRALAASTRPDVRLSHHGDGELRPVRAALLIEPDWIDYNGHLNMAYYNVLFAALWTKLTT